MIKSNMRTVSALILCIVLLVLTLVILIIDERDDSGLNDATYVRANSEIPTEEERCGNNVFASLVI